MNRVHHARTLICILLALSLSACGAWRQRLEADNAYLVGAAPIEANLVSNEALLSTSNNKRDYIGLIAFDSQKKCASFVNSLTLAQNSVNVGFDAATILFGALATAFTPLSTVHALAAAATVSTGWKNAINADIYAKASIANYAQAILATYYKDIAEYVDWLNTADESRLVASIEVTRIQAIHRTCTLAAAQATISGTLQTSTPGGATATSRDTLTVGSKVTANDRISVSALSRSLPESLVNVFVQATPADAPAAIATALLEQISKNDTLKKAGISAAQSKPDSPDGNLVLTSPSSYAVVWQTNRPDIVKFVGGSSTPASTASAPNPPIVVPGRSLR